jgi:tetratricopeptide (TPR) repeat protein
MHGGEGRSWLLISCLGFCLGSSANVPAAEKDALAALAASRSDPFSSAKPSVVVVRSDAGQASGFFIHGSRVVTNDHIVTGARWWTVKCASGRTYEATILARDAEHDLAVLATEAPAGEAPPLFFSKVFPREVDRVAMIGCPRGQEPNVTTCFVSAIRDGAEFHLKGRIIDITSIVQPGESGGPVLDAGGKVIGILCPRCAVPVERLTQLLKRAGIEAGPRTPLPPVDPIGDQAPDQAGARSEVFIGRFEASRGNHAGAVEHFRNAVRADPQNLQTALLLGEALEQAGNPSEAAAAYRAALRVDPQSCAPHLKLGRLYLDEGRLNEAAAECERAVALEGRNAQAHFLLGRARLKAGNRSGAQSEHEVLSKLDPALAGELLEEIGR